MCASSENFGEILKMRRLIGFVALATCTVAYIRVDNLYEVKHASSLFGPVDDT